MILGIDGKTALVTGGSHGIGRSIALELAKEGCRVAILARGSENLDSVHAELLTISPGHMRVRADVSKSDELIEAVKTVNKSFSSISILVNNAGGGGRWGSDDPIQTDSSVWNEVLARNFFSSMQLTRILLPDMIESNWGRIVFVTSIYGREIGGRPWFNVAKVAQTVYMKNLARYPQFARSNITLNSVAPGGIMIPNTGWESFMLKNPTEYSALMDNSYPMGRLGTPQEVANVVAFLCSERASLINGASIAVDGGESRSI